MRKKKKFNEFINKTIEELKEEKRYSTAHIYQSTLNTFCEFCGCKVVYFHQLNRANLKEFETYLRNKQLSWNTVSTYMRTLRGAYNKYNPQIEMFARFKTKSSFHKTKRII